MIRSAAYIGICLTASILGQPAANNKPRFDVASIKPSGADPHSASGIRTAPGRLDGYNVTLKRCIVGAYGVGPHQIAGGPDWLDSDRFEIKASVEQPVDGEAGLMSMLQDLLAERFRLAVHRETRVMTILALEVSKNGPKLEKSVGGEAAVTNTSTGATGVTLDARNATMESLAQILARKMDLAVVNQTGLEGAFNLRVHWIPDTARVRDAGGAVEGTSIFTAIQEQLGLRLRSEKAPVEVIVIDHAERPSAN